jgi:hypothetical protein
MRSRVNALLWPAVGCTAKLPQRSGQIRNDETRGYGTPEALSDENIPEGKDGGAGKTRMERRGGLVNRSMLVNQAPGDHGLRTTTIHRQVISKMHCRWPV